MIIFIIGGSSLQSTTMAGKFTDVGESYEFTFKPLTIIKDPLFSRPSFVKLGNVLNISLELAAEYSINEIMLVNENHSFTSEYSVHDQGNNHLSVEFPIPANADLGLYNLVVNTTLSCDSTWHSVQILSSIEPVNFSIVHLTDTHIGINLPGVDATRDLQAALDRINSMSPLPSFVLFTGDLIQGLRRENFVSEFNESMNLLSQLNSPIFMINGNHEFSNGLDLWEEYFGKDYQYSFDYNSLHVTLISHYDNQNLPQSNITWIKDDISSHSDQTTLFCYHSDFKGQFDDVGADYHILGHEHSSYVINKNGYTEIVTGNSYEMSTYEPGEFRVLNFQNGSLISYSMLETPYNTDEVETTAITVFSSITTSVVDTSTQTTSLDLDYLVVFIAFTVYHVRRKKKR